MYSKPTCVRLIVFRPANPIGMTGGFRTSRQVTVYQTSYPSAIWERRGAETDRRYRVRTTNIVHESIFIFIIGQDEVAISKSNWLKARIQDQSDGLLLLI